MRNKSRQSSSEASEESITDTNLTLRDQRVSGDKRSRCPHHHSWKTLQMSECSPVPFWESLFQKTQSENKDRTTPTKKKKQQQQQTQEF